MRDSLFLFGYTLVDVKGGWVFLYVDFGFYFCRRDMRMEDRGLFVNGKKVWVHMR